MLVGYARVSTPDQSLDSQTDDLLKQGCEKIFSDIASGGKAKRPGLDEAIKFCRRGDVLVVWKLDRLGRSMTHLVESVKELKKSGVEFKSLTEKIDTTTPGGRLVFHLFSALAEFERDLIRERVQSGLRSARARGRTGGRPPVSDETKIMAQALMDGKKLSVRQICSRLGIARSTLYKHVKIAGRD